MWNKKEIISFVKEWKKSFIGLGIFLLLIIFIIGNLIFSFMGGGSYSLNNIKGDSFNGRMAMTESISSPQSMKMMRGDMDIMPISDDGVTEYDDEVERKIIKNGNLSLVVKSIEVAKNEIQKITKKFDGFVQSSNFRENENYEYYNGERRSKNSTKSGYFELKIPSKNFELAFNEYKKTALKINNESVSGRDVTEEFLDLESQIKNKQAEVDQYRNILKRAEKVEDILKVTKYLNSAQLELDRKQGRLNYLSNQVELSSIRIDIVSEKDVEVFGIVWSPLTELKQGFSNMLGDLRDFADMLIAFFFKLPWLILNFALWILGFYAFYRIFKIGKKKFLEK